MDIASQVFKLNKKYEENQYNGINNREDGSNYRYIQGSIPILISAPHAVKQERDGVVKMQDGNTGGIVEYLCCKNNYHGIIRNYNKQDDPNYDIAGIGLEYKKKLISIIKEKKIKFLLDIHGCKNTYGFDFELGTNNGKNINQNHKELLIIQNFLNKIGKVEIDSCFKASREGNISKYVAENANIPSIQLEISREFRIDSKKLEIFIQTMEKMIKEFVKVIEIEEAER